MKLLLDTHVFLWWWQDSARLRKRARDAIAGADLVFVSAVSAWEMAIKASLGRLQFDDSFGAAVDACGFSRLPVEFPHVEALRLLPPHHVDPFDRMLIAQASVESLTLVTHDRAIATYSIAQLRV